MTPTALIISICALLHAVAPRLVQLGWTLVGGRPWSPCSRRPWACPWARTISPFYAAGQVPIQDPDTVALLAMITLVIVAILKIQQHPLPPPRPHSRWVSPHGACAGARLGTAYG